MRISGCVVFSFVLATAAGCDFGTEGELGRGDFVYTCDLGADDALCESAGDEQGVPQVAVGGEFTLRYDSHDFGAFVVRPASRRHVASGVTAFTVGLGGPTGFFSLDWDGDMYDLVHVWARSVASLDLRCEGWFGSPGSCGDAVQMQMDGTETVEAFPLASNGELLGGVLEYTWEIADASVASLEVAGPGRAARIRAEGPGTTTLTVGAGGVSASVGITVEGGGDTDTETLTDTETGTETDTGSDTDTEVDGGADAGVDGGAGSEGGF